MKAFEIDYKKLAVMLTPTFLRSTLLTALLRVLMQPMTTIHTTFKSKREQHLFNLSHNGQVCYLKDALNKEFGLDYSNGFEISDINAEGDFIFAYDETEWLQDTNRVWIVEHSPTYSMIYDEASITPSTASFIVYVPFLYEVGSDIDYRIRSIVEQYRLVSRTPEYRLKLK